MRKSSVVMLAIVAILLVALTWAAKFFADQFAEEIGHAKEITRAFRDDEHALAPDSTVRLARVMGSSKTLVTDPQSPGLLLEAAPSVETWKADPSGFQIARRMALHLFEAYGPDRPIRWIQFRLERTDGTRLPEFALARGDGDALLPVVPNAPEKPPVPSTPAPEKPARAERPPREPPTAADGSNQPPDRATDKPTGK